MNERLTDSGFFVLRTPVLALSELDALVDGAQAPSAAEAELDAALDSDRAAQRARLLALAKRPEVATALWVGSPALSDTLHGDAGADPKAEESLLRYVTRMAARPTPFGLFAGCSLGDIGDVTLLDAPRVGEWRRNTRLDADYLDSLIHALVESETLRNRVVLRPNGSLRRHGDRLRYVETRLAEGSRTYHLVEVTDSRALSAALALAAAGARLPEIAATVAETSVTPDAAERFARRLLTTQVLVPDLALAVTGAPPLETLIADLEALETKGDPVRFAPTLREVKSALAELDTAGTPATPDQHRAIADLVAELPVPVKVERLLQVDLTGPPGRVTLDRATVDEIVRGADLLRRIAPPVQPSALDRFRERFGERYESREVPLLEALDDELGVGYGATEDPSPLLDGLRFPAAAATDGALGTREHHLLALLEHAWSSGADEIVLTRRDVDALAASDPLPFPSATGAVAAIAGRQIVLQGVLGPPGAKLIGRFCHADPGLEAAVRRHLTAEEELDRDAIHAEIAHLPAGRVANILARPVLRDFEIEWLGRSGAAPGRRLPASDLLLTLRDGGLVLRSGRLGRRVVPRLTAAHAWSRGPVGVYRFLCDLQAQDAAYEVAWSWGPFAMAPHLPRVRHGRVVLAPARWRAHADELRDLDGWRAVQRWRGERGLPRRVTLVEHDNVLPIDFDAVLSVEAFARRVRQREAIALAELIAPAATHANEVVVPLVRRGSVSQAKSPQADVAAPVPSSTRTPRDPVPRVFAPGSEWVYLKLYTGTATADRLLRDVIGPAAQKLVHEAAADRWFFLRYADPGFHLRVRLRGDGARVRTALETIAADALERGLAHDALFGTYQREIERYGGPAAIDAAERLFHADSDAVIELLRRFEGGKAGLDERWRVSLLGAERLLVDLGLDGPARAAIAERMRDAFAREHRADPALRRALGDRARRERHALQSLLDVPADADHPLAPGIAVLDARSDRVAPIVTELRALGVALDELAVSFVHMWVNRLMRSANRQHEYVLYDLLAGLARTRAARAQARR